MKKKTTKSLTRKVKQTGTTNLKIDRKRKALPPGKRISKSRNVYYEYRKNRSDVVGYDAPMKRKTTTLKKKVTNADKLKKARIEAYKEKKEAKKERVENLMRKFRSASNQAYETQRKSSSFIPFGQPILVGHHSERSHRSHIKKLDNLMRKSVEYSDKSEYYADKLTALNSDRIISSDDPEATDKLKKKLDLLEKQRVKIVTHNKLARKEKKATYPAYILQNLSQNIRTTRLRLESLKKLATMKTSSEVVKGVKVIKNADINRIQLEFPSIPNVEIRTLLKGWGFKWSPSQGRWQRQLNNTGLYSAKKVLEKL